MEDNNLVNDFKGKCTIPSQFEYAYLSNANGLWFFFTPMIKFMQDNNSFVSAAPPGLQMCRGIEKACRG